MIRIILIVCDYDLTKEDEDDQLQEYPPKKIKQTNNKPQPTTNHYHC